MFIKKDKFCMKSFSSTLPYLNFNRALQTNSCFYFLSRPPVSGKDMYGGTSRLHNSQYAKLEQNPGILISNICYLGGS